MVQKEALQHGQVGTAVAAAAAAAVPFAVSCCGLVLYPLRSRVVPFACSCCGLVLYPLLSHVVLFSVSCIACCRQLYVAHPWKASNRPKLLRMFVDRTKRCGS
ncbi:unnamed protein product [Ectocarpus sp. 4 AP-2014]